MGWGCAGARLGADPSALEHVAEQMRSLASTVDSLARRRPTVSDVVWTGRDAEVLRRLLDPLSTDVPELVLGLRRGERKLRAAAAEQRLVSRPDPSIVVTVDRPTGDGRLIQRIGPPDATVLVVIVPGVGTDRGDRTRLARDARRLWGALTERVDDASSVAVVSWLGYDPPDLVAGAIDVGPAADGARSLAAWVESERRSGARRVTLVGHSYGGIVVGRAAVEGAPTDVVVQLGSPGSGAPGAVDEIEGRGVELRAVRAPGDPIGLVAGRLRGLYGEDAVGTVRSLPTGAHGHSGYLSDRQLIDAVADLAAGSRSTAAVR